MRHAPRSSRGHFFLAVFFRVTHDGLSERGSTRSLVLLCGIYFMLRVHMWRGAVISITLNIKKFLDNICVQFFDISCLSNKLNGNISFIHQIDIRFFARNPCSPLPHHTHRPAPTSTGRPIYESYISLKSLRNLFWIYCLLPLFLPSTVATTSWSHFKEFYHNCNFFDTEWVALHKY